MKIFICHYTDIILSFVNKCTLLICTALRLILVSMLSERRLNLYSRYSSLMESFNVKRALLQITRAIRKIKISMYKDELRQQFCPFMIMTKKLSFLPDDNQ